MLKEPFDQARAPYGLLMLTFWAVSIDTDRQQRIERCRRKEKQKRQQVYNPTCRPKIACP